MSRCYKREEVGNDLFMTNAISGLGLAPDAAMITFPIDMFLPGSDISALEARKNEFYEALTGWQSAFAKAAAGEVPMLKVEGETYEDALQRANDLAITNLWGDRLPLWPATPTPEWTRPSAAPPAHPWPSPGS